MSNTIIVKTTDEIMPLVVSSTTAPVPYGKCHCGCGGTTPIAKVTDRRVGIKKGEHYKWIHGHSFRQKRRGDTRMQNGYIQVRAPDHPRQFHGWVFEHILIAEKIFGGPLPLGYEVHHVGEKTDNSQLVICANRAEHMLLHRQERALAACGHKDWRKCTYCKQWDAPANLITTKGHGCYHRTCNINYCRERKAATKPAEE